MATRRGGSGGSGGKPVKPTGSKKPGRKKPGRKKPGGKKPSSKPSARKRSSSPGSRKRASSARGRSRKPTRRRKGSRRRSPGLGGLLRDLGRWLAWRVGALGLGIVLGLAAVSGILYRQALSDVDQLLDRPVWSQTGRVLSGAMEIWPGLSLTSEELAQDLQRAGYARVPQAHEAGDFEVSAERMRILVPAAEGPGWKADAGEHIVTFSGGRVALADGKQRLRFAPSELASVRGPDNEARRPVALDEIPDHLVEAVLAMEDARFRDHEGLDPLGIARALLVNAAAGTTVQGGSTLTQQTVKNLFLSHERSYERKAKEALLAIALEQRRSKDEILALYLNEIYLGQVGGAAVCGVEQAARAYFGKPVDRLELGESAAIAGMISAPNRYSPLKHPEAALERRDIALGRMADVGAITPDQAEAAKARPLQVHAVTSGRRAPWVVDAALESVEHDLGQGSVAARGLAVHTSIQPALQRLAERAVGQAAAELDEKHPDAAGAQLALVAVRVRDGAVVALVGGRDYLASQFDRASNGRRQLGSTVKPLTWLFAFDADPDLSPGSVVIDEPIERTVDGKTWSPANYDRAYVGPISLREALVHSRNVPAVLVAEQVGMARLERLWQAAGLSTATDWPSAALGSFGATPLELAGAYTAFPQGGEVSQPRIVLGVVGPEGHEELPATPPVRSRVASAQAAWMATDVLREVVERGTGRSARTYGVQGAVGGKTGTTDDGRDAWFAGFTDELAVVVWVGFDKGRALGLTGSQAALPAWARFVAASGTQDGRLPQPAGLVQVELCKETGLPPCDGLFGGLLGGGRHCEETATDWFLEGHEPDGDCGRMGLIEQLRRDRGDAAGSTQDGAEPDQADDEDGKRRGLFRRRRNR